MRASNVKRRFRLTGDAAIAPPTRKELDDAYRGVAARVGEQLETRDGSGRDSSVVLLTATVPGEGLSTTALHVGHALTTRKPSTTVAIVDSANGAAEVGWLDVVRNRASLEDALRGVDETVPRVLPRGGSAFGLEATTTSHREIHELLETLRKAFSYVVIDGPLLHARADLDMWLPAVDGVALVVEANRSRWETLLPNVKLLEESSAPFLGIVLNKRQHFIPDEIYGRL